jgi:DNA-binding PadR family transcriptional regulator
MKGDHVGEFEELVLLAIRQLGEEAYGVSIQRLLEKETSRRVSIGAVYASLDRLETKGFVRSAMTPGHPIRGGRSRRAFVVSARGLRAIEQVRRLRERLWRPGSAIS